MTKISADESLCWQKFLPAIFVPQEILFLFMLSQEYNEYNKKNTLWVNGYNKITTMSNASKNVE